MGSFFAVIGGIWFWGGILIAAPYFWFKRTNRSQSPIERRLRAGIMGLGWPYFVFKHFTGKSEAEAAERERQAAADRIIGGAPTPRQGEQPGTPATPRAAADGMPPVPPAPAAGAGSRIANPFDNL
jgi:hypothetical protein